MKTTKAEIRAHVLGEVLKVTKRSVPTRQIKKAIDRKDAPIEVRLKSIGLTQGDIKLLLQNAFEWLNTQEAINESNAYILPEKVMALL